MKIAARATALLSLILAAGCGGKDTAAPISVDQVVISPRNFSLAPGETRQLTATTSDADGNSLPARVITWTSSNTSVATVGATTGLVTAVSDGSASITATSEGEQDDVTVTVITRVATVTIDPSASTLVLPGTTQQFSAMTRDASGNVLTGRPVTWSSSNPAVATVDATSGLVTPLRAGTTQIIATSEEISDTTVVLVELFVPGSITSAFGHTCALTTSGSAYCWGSNESGQLGDETTTTRTSPVAVSGGLTFETITTGGGTTFGITSTGALYGWGQNNEGQLGDGTNTNRHAPVPIGAGLTFRAVAAGNGHTAAITTGGAAYAWGRNNLGQLGDGTTTGRNTPGAVLGGLTFISISAGPAHSMALTSDGKAYGWGYNFHGQLGDGTTVDRLSPVAVLGGRTFVVLKAGLGTSAAIESNGTAYTWGDNAFGQLGDGTTTLRSAPGPVAGGIAFRTIDPGMHTTAISLDGVGYAWGFNERGQLGDGTTINRSTPTPVSGGLTFKKISSSGTLDFTTALTLSGAAYGWGRNSLGRLGDGTTTDKHVPTAVSGGLTFK